LRWVDKLNKLLTQVAFVFMILYKVASGRIV